MSSALGLMLDESTTVASEGMLILYLRYPIGSEVGPELIPKSG